jgi:putative transposase
VATVSCGGTSERFEFIERYRKNFKVTFLCDWLKVSRSGFYAWRIRTVSLRDAEDKALTAKIVQIHKDSRGTYGSPRVHMALKKQGVAVGKKRIERLMQAQGLQGRVFKVTKRFPNYKGYLKRGDNLRLNQPAPTKINQVWVADLTYIKVRDTYKYLIVIMDLYSRRILNWSLTTKRTTVETSNLLRRAVQERQPDEGLIFHTDRGIEFTGHDFTKVLKKHHIKPSVNRLGYCTDNGHMESYFHSLKTELIRGRTFNTMNELRYALNSYINHFYNKKRLHSGIDYCSPIEYEKIAA